MFRFLLILTLIFTLSLGWMHQKGDLPTGIRTIESLLHPVFHKESVYHYATLYKQDPLLILALVKTESHFFKKARSARGAVGLMQLMPSTAKDIAKDLNLKNFKAEDLEEADVNIRFGTYYLSKLHKEFGNDTITALAAYNAGSKNVRDWLKIDKTKTLRIERIEFFETKKFVQEVLSTYHQLKKLKELRSKIIKKVVKKYENTVR